MSKMKLSFSLFFAIFLVGILSTAAFATGGPYNLKAVYDSTSNGFVATFNVTDANQSPAGYKIDLVGKDSTGAYTVDVLKAFATSVDAGSKSWSGYENGTATIAPADTTSGSFTKGATYQVVLYAADGTTVLEKAYAVYNVDSANTLLLHDGTSKTAADGTTTLTVDPQGSGLVNDNQTGFGNLSKARSGQRVHGFYQNNTNSCASCHQTHTAKNGESLLFKDGVYSTCSACHDGTTGAMNSFEPADSSTPTSIAGTFDIHDANQNGSLHEADGSLDVTAAPGGHTGVTNTDNATAVATYGAEFDCASCHAAHGGGSTHENNLNLDPLGWGGIQYATTNSDTQNGKLFRNVQIVDLTQTGTTLPATETTPYILVKKVLASSDVSTDKTKTGYLYSRAGLAAGDTVIQTYRWTGTPVTANGKTSYGYVPDFSLFLRDVGHVGAPFMNANTAFYNTSTPPATRTVDNGGVPVPEDITAQLNIIWKDGFVYEKASAPSVAFDSIKSADISLGIDVEDTSDIASLFDSKNANYVVDSGTEMSKYCASCHVDYASVTRTQETGVYTSAHRHATLQDRLTCVRCHYAHGSEAKTMKDANDQTYWTLSTDGTGTQAPSTVIDYLKDPNPSSAIKRYTGMSVCYACHGKGEQFAGNASNQVLKAGDPGAARTDWTK